MLHPDRLFPADPGTRDVARKLFAEVEEAPILSPHGHTNPAWFAENQPFPNPAALLIVPDHYVFRMLYSQGVPMERLGVPDASGRAPEVDPRDIWRTFAQHYFLFRGTPTRLWMDFCFERLFGLRDRLCAETADEFYDVIEQHLRQPEFLPRALFDRFRIEVLSTTDSPLDTLEHHQAIRASGWGGRVLPTFRPDPVIDAGFAGFRGNVDRLGAMTGEDTSRWSGYLSALRQRRAFFRENGATATDHGHSSAQTADLSTRECEDLFARVYAGSAGEDGAAAEDAMLLQAQMLTEMARMSVEDGLTMQLHPGSFRNHNQEVYRTFGRDKGADIPVTTEYVRGLRPLLSRFGNEPNFRLILFTLDETTYSRELAPLAGHYPAVFLGPAWWFHDSPEGMMRLREQTTETAGFYNMVGFNDDTRAFLSIPARHDVARRIDAAYLARLVAEHRLDEDEAVQVIRDLTTGLVRRAYRL